MISNSNNEVRKCGLIVLISPSTLTIPTGSKLEAPEIRMPPYYGHTAVNPTVSTLEGLYCTPYHFEVLCEEVHLRRQRKKIERSVIQLILNPLKNSISNWSRQNDSCHSNNFTCDCTSDLWPPRSYDEKLDLPLKVQQTLSLYGLPAHVHTQGAHCEWPTFMRFIDCSW